ncbi:cytochrome c class I [Hydrogenobaculum sp. Y04AAS1]|uniref:c-type cytochrome n=1 Tax=Hydrogenobaculum sp. (strain Y04AAS1) TaxID=380749 RepID=UPI00015BD183|nr:cytochrome c class I [Hydrogenobaculum sp. Y04AAS1]
MKKTLLGAAVLALGLVACSHQQSSESSSASSEQPAAATTSTPSSPSTTSTSTTTTSSSSSAQICSGTGAQQVCASASSINQDDAKKLVAMAGTKGCLACHAVDKQVVGPAWIDVAKKYAGKPNAVETLAKGIKNGNQGIWGAVPMPAQTSLSDADAKQLAQMVLALYNKNSSSSSSSSSNNKEKSSKKEEKKTEKKG